MRRFVYISTANTLPEAEVDAIVAAAERNNERLGLTGFLYYNGRNFLQLLEGPEAPLLRMISTLARDPRHAGMLKLADEPIAERSCPDWRMHRLRLAGQGSSRREALASELPRQLSPVVRELVTNFAVLN
ncbi:MAG: BLUF domain-containing protein [Cypionkella sp.]